jgi:hypothetical protein
MGFVLANKCVCDVSFPACIWDVIWFKTCYPEAIHTSGGPSLYLNQVPKSIGVDRDLFYWNSCTAVVRNPLKYYTALFQCSSHHIASNVRFPERPLIGQLFFFFCWERVWKRGWLWSRCREPLHITDSIQKGQGVNTHQDGVGSVPIHKVYWWNCFQITTKLHAVAKFS